MRNKKKKQGGREALVVPGRSEKREEKGSRTISKSRGKKTCKCFIYHKEGHFKKDCPDQWKKHKAKEVKDAEVSVA